MAVRFLAVIVERKMFCGEKLVLEVTTNAVPRKRKTVSDTK